MNSCIDLPLHENEIKDVIEKAQDWALTHGLCIRTPSLNLDKVQIAPFLLLPSTFPKTEFLKAVNIQTTLNLIIHKIAYDYEFLHSCLSSTIKSDDFTRRLFEIYETVRNENDNFAKAYNLGILRSDYMCNDVNKIKQVEVNTIASSFGGLSTKASEYHRFILSFLGHSSKLNNLPVNHSINGISSGLVEAWNIFKNPKSAILFVVEEQTVNIADQRFVEFQINLLNPSIKVIRRSMKALREETKLDTNKDLIVENYVVSVVYYRSAYDPSLYTSEKDWEVRLMIERSNAIKCPSIQYQLAGTKKVQQMLSTPTILSNFTKNEKEQKQVQDLLVNLYALEFDKAGDEAVKLALENPDKFVLKPQREGGGHNIYGNDIKTILDNPKKLKERTGYILMDKINSPPQKNYLLRAGSTDKHELKNVVLELGIYGVILGNQDKVIVNNQVGFLLRTKLQTSNEGGVAAGFGAIDSPYLV